MRTLGSLVLAAALALVGVGCGEGVELNSSDSTSSSSANETGAPLPVPKKIQIAGDGKTLIGPGGTRYRIDPKGVTGYVDNAVVNGKYIDMSGWAAPADLSRSAKLVVAATTTRAVAVGVPSRERPDLVEGYEKSGLSNAGFAISVPRSALDCSAPDQGLTTYGLAGRTASPLKWLADVPQVVAEAC